MAPRFGTLLLLLLTVVALWERPAGAFTFRYGIGRSVGRSRAISISTSMFSSGGAESEYTTALPVIDFHVFLTQRTVQSFMFLLSQTRDMYTIRWLDNFTRPVIPEVGGAELRFDDNSSIPVDPFLGEAGKGGLMKPGSRLLMYHGLDALNATLFPTWDSYFEQLLDQPKEILEISSGNPGTPFRTFDVEIEPPRLCSRMLAVRSQIAQEWVEDLGFLANMTAEHVLSSYWANVKLNRTAGFDREALWFLEYIETESEESDYSPNPLRKGSFDLLKNLATQESIHRVLSQTSPFANEEDDNDEVAGAVSKEFLRTFYLEHMDSHFRGYVRYGKADDFIEELMLCPPRLVTAAAGQGEVTGLVDPLRLAEAVMKERERVAMDWKELAGQSPQNHIEIQKMQLDKMHQRPADEEMTLDPFTQQLLEAQQGMEDSRAITDGGDSSWQ